MGGEVNDGTEGDPTAAAADQAVAELAPAEAGQHPTVPEEVDVRVCPGCGKD
jgi:hypothetical protein